MAAFTSEPYLNKDVLEQVASPFQRLNVSRDFAKEIFVDTALDRADVILIDLIDERFDLLLMSAGQLITASAELLATGFLKNESLLRTISLGTPERRTLWLAGAERFLVYLSDKRLLSKVVVNKVFWASRFDNPSSVKFPTVMRLVDVANQELEWMYATLGQWLLADQFLDFEADLLLANAGHRWGPSPFHYIDDYYHQALKKLALRQHQVLLMKEATAALEIGQSTDGLGGLNAAPPYVHWSAAEPGFQLMAKAWLEHSKVHATCSTDQSGNGANGVTYAFYLLVDGVRQAMRWYEQKNDVYFEHLAVKGKLEIVAFARDNLGGQVKLRIPVEITGSNNSNPPSGASFVPAERLAFTLAKDSFEAGGELVPINANYPLRSHAQLRVSCQAPLLVTAVRNGNVITAECQVWAEHFSGELEYAFYLMVGGKKSLVHWYTPSSEVCLTVPDDVGSQVLEVCGFVREKMNPEKKLIRAATVEQ